MPIHFVMIDSRNRNDFHIPTTLILLKSLFSRWRTEWNADWTSWRKILKRQRWPSSKNEKKMFRCSISSSRQTSPRGFGWVSHQFCTHGKAAHPLFSAFYGSMTMYSRSKQVSSNGWFKRCDKNRKRSIETHEGNSQSFIHRIESIKIWVD